MADGFDTNELSMLSMGEGRASRSRSRSRSASRSASRSDKRGRGSTAREARRGRRRDTSDSNLEETKEQAGEQKSHGKYPLQFKLLYNTRDKHDKPRAMARALNDWEFFTVLDWNKDSLFHKTGGLPEELVKLTHWNPKAWDQLKSLMIEMMEEIEIDLNGQWSLQSGITDVDHEGIENLMKKYDELPKVSVIYTKQFRDSLIVRPSLGNTIGRSALFNLCTMMWHLIPVPYFQRCQPVNVGGGATTWGGNGKIGYIYCNQEDLTDKKLGDLLSKRSVSDKQMRVCDFQIMDPVAHRYWLSGEIKTADDMIGIVKEWEARKQTWEQALPGLRDDDESYAILFTPKEAEFFQLRLSQSKRVLCTYTKTYSLRRQDLESLRRRDEETLNKFATDQLEKLMVDLMGIMFRVSVNIWDSAGGSSSKQ